MDAPVKEPKNLRMLRRLVTVLTVVMIGGLLTIVAVIVMQFTRSATPAAPLPALPQNLTLPAGETAGAVTFGSNWLAVVTVDDTGVERIRLFSTDGTAMQSLKIGGAE